VVHRHPRVARVSPDQVVVAGLREALVPIADLKLRLSRRRWFVSDERLVAEPGAGFDGGSRAEAIARRCELSAQTRYPAGQAPRTAAGTKQECCLGAPTRVPHSIA
jgi:hypothetical protein